MPVLRCPIPLGVQTPHIFRQKISIHFKIGLYVEGSCAYRFVLFVNFYITRYKDIALQSRYIFPARFAPFYGQRQHVYSTLPWAYAAFRKGGGPIFLIGDLNYNTYLSVISIFTSMLYMMLFGIINIHWRKKLSCITK